MKTKLFSGRYLTFAIALLIVFGFLGGQINAQTKDEKAVKEIVLKNAEAFEKGDLEMMSKIWLDDEKVTVIEAGNFDYGWRSFRDKHLAPELKAMQNRRFTASDIRVHVKGKMAWTTFAYKFGATFGERKIDAEGAA